MGGYCDAERGPLLPAIEQTIKEHMENVEDYKNAAELIRKNPEVVELLNALRKIGY